MNDPAFAAAPEKQRTRAQLWLIAMNDLPAGLPVTGDHGVLAHLARSMGVTQSKAKRVLYAWRETGDWRVLCDGRALAARELVTDGARCPRFREWALHEFEQAPNDLQAVANIHNVLLAGQEVVPGFEYLPMGPRKALPPGVSRTSLFNLVRRHRREMEQARRGLKAANKYRQHVLRTRAGMLPGQMYMFDDVDLDNKIVAMGQVVRLKEFGALDVASACRVFWGNIPAERRENDEKTQNLNKRMFVPFVAWLLYHYGYHKDGCVLQMERGTATLPERQQALLRAHGFKIRMGAMHGKEQARIGGYEGRSGGNPRAKAELESSHRAVHACFAGLPGQLGARYDLMPEETYGQEQAQKDVERIRRALLAAGHDDLANQLKNHLPTLEEFRQFQRIAYQFLNSRRDHNLEGWRENGNYETVFQLTPGQWTPARLLTDDSGALPSPLLAAASVPGFTREVKLSPAEVWEMGKADLVRIPFTLYVDLIKEDSQWGRCLQVRSGLIGFKDAMIGPQTLYYYAKVQLIDGGERLLEDGDAVRVVLNPYDLEHLIIMDNKGRILGMADRYHRVSLLDEDALNKQTGRVNAFNAARDAAQRLRFAGKRDSIAAINGHNRILAQQGGVYGRRAQIAATSTLTPSDKAAVTRAAKRSEIDVFEGLGVLPEPAAAPASLPEPPASGSDITLDDII